MRHYVFRPTSEDIAVNDKEIAALADRIAAGRRSRQVMEFLAADTANLSEADSYKVQFAVHDRLTADGKDAMAGWKVALTLPSQYEPMKLSGPVFAGIYKSGVRPTGAVFEKGWPIKAGIECEMVARISKDATAGGYTADSIKAHVASFHCGAEVVENRYADVTTVSGPGQHAERGISIESEGLAEGGFRRPERSLGVRGQGDRRRPWHQRHGQRPDLARLARQQASGAR